MFARSASIPARGHRVHQARLAQLAREAGRTTAQHIAGYERQRRHATLVAITLDLGAALTDQAIDLFDRLVGTMFSKAEDAACPRLSGRRPRHQREGSPLCPRRRRPDCGARGRTGSVRGDHRGDPLGALSRQRRRSGGAGAPGGLRFLPDAGRALRYGMRRWAPAFLATFSFEGVPAAASLLQAVEMLREMNGAASAKLPKSAPTGFVRERWARYVMPGGALDRRYYELCVLSELRDRLRAGDVWVVGSRRYRSFEERLISRETLQELLQSGTLPVAVDPDFERFIAGRRTLLDARLTAIDAKAKDGLLPDVSLEKGVLKIAPIEKSTPPEAEALAARLYAMLPRIRITDLLSEVARWTLFTDCFTHLTKRRNGRRPANSDGGPPGRRPQSRPDAHGRGLHDRQPRTARLGR